MNSSAKGGSSPARPLRRPRGSQRGSAARKRGSGPPFSRALRAFLLARYADHPTTPSRRSQLLPAGEARSPARVAFGRETSKSAAFQRHPRGSSAEASAEGARKLGPTASAGRARSGGRRARSGEGEGLGCAVRGACIEVLVICKVARDVLFEESRAAGRSPPRALCWFARCCGRFRDATPHEYLRACTVSHIRRVACDFHCFLWT